MSRQWEERGHEGRGRRGRDRGYDDRFDYRDERRRGFGAGKALLALIVVIVGVAAAIGLYIVQKQNSFIRQENGIVAAYDANRAVLDEVMQGIRGSNLSVEQYGDLVLNAIKAAMSGRYGTEGSKASMQWIQEQMPTIDPGVFQKLQQIIEANLAKWRAAQVTLRDRVRVYEDDIQVWPSSFVAKWRGFPRPGFDMALYKRMIVTADTSEAFDKGRMKSIDDLLGKKKQ